MPDGPGFALRGWLALTWALQPILPRHLRKRVARGKEHPERWREKLGHPSQPRPNGRLIWLHAVGLGEVLALRGLIARLSEMEPDLSFLVTSGTRASAEVLDRNMPARTVHQFLPLDAPGPIRRFLDHWRPDLSIWAEQELWPGLVYHTDTRGIPLALVNARMNDAAFARRRKGRKLYADLLARFAVVSAQEDTTARHLSALGATRVAVDGSLKQIAPELSEDGAKRAWLESELTSCPRWLAASSHCTDEAVALEAHGQVLKRDPASVLIIAPRLPDRAGEIETESQRRGFRVARLSSGHIGGASVVIADSFGDMGIWYRLCPVALMGGSMGEVEGHNPWEGARLGCAILHGPHVANFANDYAALQDADAARKIATANDLANALADPALPEMARRGQTLACDGMDRMDGLCQKLLTLIA